jgi:D-arabinose 1-dehydrogenase-like Zn-dependent alcohol dehydrogenase
MHGLEYKLLGPYRLALEEVLIEWPPKKLPRILCKTKFTGISPGTEVAAWSGQKKLRSSGGYPRKLGYQNISEVINTSGEVPGVKIGDIVYTNQGHTSTFSCEPQDILGILPCEGETRKFLFAYMYHMGLCALSTKAMTQAEEHKVSIFGAGALGLTVAELSKELALELVLVSDIGKPFLKNSQEFVRVNREIFKQEYRFSKIKFQHSIITTNNWDDYNMGLATLGNHGTLTLLGFPGRDGKLPLTNPFEPNFFYVNNLSVFSTPNLRKDLFDATDTIMSLQDSIFDIFQRISSGNLGQTYKDVEMYDYKELGNVYSEIERRTKGAITAGIDWSTI